MREQKMVLEKKMRTISVKFQESVGYFQLHQHNDTTAKREKNGDR